MREDPREALALEVAAAARDLGASAREVSWPAPWVVCGRVDGRSFYLQERSDVYKVVIAPDELPELDVWRMDHGTGVTIATGAATDFLDGTQGESPARAAVNVAVAAVRTHLRRRSCAHLSDPADRYCRTCGIALVNPARP